MSTARGPEFSRGDLLPETERDRMHTYLGLLNIGNPLKVDPADSVSNSDHAALELHEQMRQAAVPHHDEIAARKAFLKKQAQLEGEPAESPEITSDVDVEIALARSES